MTSASARTGVLIASGVAILLIWWLSRTPWTSHTQTLGIRDDEHVEWTTTTTEHGSGADYFLGGNLVLLLAGGWLLYAASRPDPDLQLAGLVTLASALHAAIALGRLFVAFINLPDDPTMRYYSAGSDLTGTAACTTLLTLALAALGIASFVLAKSKPAAALSAPTPAPAPNPPSPAPKS